ncbi:MAG: hypothetical protein RLZZ507_3376 [Cyanobacteriota bacterium]
MAYLIDTNIILIIAQPHHLTNSYPYHDLDYLAGTWTKEDETEFLLNTQHFNEIDQNLWQ